jgi:quercetin dioxygenase-like cupin family protein
LSDVVFVHASERPPATVDRGVRRRVLGHGADLMMVSVEFDAGAIGALHAHPHRQVTYVASGAFRVTVDGREAVLRAGDSFYVAADLRHGVEAIEAGTLVDVFTPARDDFLE